jgi:hypothetical protein
MGVMLTRQRGQAYMELYICATCSFMNRALVHCSNFTFTFAVDNKDKQCVDVLLSVSETFITVSQFW